MKEKNTKKDCKNERNMQKLQRFAKIIRKWEKKSIYIKVNKKWTRQVTFEEIVHKIKI